MAIIRVNTDSDATWVRCWQCDTLAEVDVLAATWSSPGGPKRCDQVFENEFGNRFMFTDSGNYFAISGLASLPINLNSDVVDRLPYPNLPEVNGPALVGNPNPGLADMAQFQPSNAGDVLYYDGTDLVFQPLEAEKVIGAAVNIPFNAGDFTGSGSLVWTVTAPNVNDFSYVFLNNSFVNLNINIGGASMSGAGIALQVALPSVITPLKSVALPALVYNNGVFEPAFLTMTGGVPQASFILNTLANYNTPGPNSTYINVTYEV